MKARAAEINSDFVALTEARNQRRKIFAHPDNGLFATAARIRNAVKAIFGNPSDELRTVQSIGLIG